MARSLRSSPITGPSSLLPSGPPLCLASGPRPLPVLRLGASPGRTGRRSDDHEPGSRETTGSHVPYRSLTRARAAYMPGTAWAVDRLPPGSSQVRSTNLVSMPSSLFRHVICDSLAFAFIGSHLTRSWRAFSATLDTDGSLPPHLAVVCGLSCKATAGASPHLLHSTEAVKSRATHRSTSSVSFMAHNPARLRHRRPHRRTSGEEELGVGQREGGALGPLGRRAA